MSVLAGGSWTRMFLPFILVTSTAGVAGAAGFDQIYTQPSYRTAGIIVTLSGDDGDESVTIEVQGPKDSGFKAAHPLVRYDPHAFATSLWSLSPDSDYQVRVSVDDPDGVTGDETSTVTIHTHADDDALPAPSRTRWVGTSGRDQADAGTSKNDPFATIGYALGQASPGDEVRVLSGTYAPVSVNGLHGTAQAPIVVRADDPTNRPVIDGNGEGAAVELDDVSYVVLDGFEVTNGGGDDDGMGVYLRASAHIVVRNSYVHDNGHYNVLISKSAQFSGGATQGGFHLIEDDDIADVDHDSCASPTSEQCPGQTYYGVKLDNNAGAGTVIRRNHIWGHGDNVSPCGDENVGRDLGEDQEVLALTGGGTWTNHDLEVYDNVIEDARDDGIELDGICVNARVWRNTIRGAQNAFSVAPALPGPYFVVRNVVTGTWGEAGVKLNTAGNSAVPERNIFFYHNTFQRTDKGPVLNLWFAVEGDHNVPVENLVFRNNVFATPAGGPCTAAYNHGEEQPSFDGDVWYSTDSSDLFQWWNGTSTDTYDTFEAFQAGTGEEGQGIFGVPGLDDELFPTEGALVLDRAIRIPGINDGYAGSAPDVGAFELGADAPPGSDGGPVGPDGGMSGDGSGDDGAGDRGCGCRASGFGASPVPRLFAFGLVGWLITRRRRRPKRRS